MKNKKLYVFVGLLFLFVFGIMNVRSIRSDDIVVSSEFDLFPITAGANMSSTFFDINTSIYIEGNWSETALANEWCSGEGSEENPWILENINMTNDQKNAQIVIETAEHFIIRNVIVSEYAKPYGHRSKAGIYIEKGEYGLIENCTIVNCSTGISLYEAYEELKIINCDFIGSHNDSITGLGPAVLMYEAKEVNISYNNIYAYYSGVVIRDSEDCYVDNNRIEAVFDGLSDTGVYFYNTNNSEITNNDFYGCEATTEHSFGITTLKLSSSYIPITIDPNCYNITVYGNTFEGQDTDIVVVGGSDDLFNILYIIGLVCVYIAVFCAVLVIRKIKKIK
jgi:parallel beta-helix repeat protein